MALALPLLWAGRARADDCPATATAPIYGSGGSATKPLIAKVATQLANAPTPITVFYASPGACVGVNALFGPTPITGTVSWWNTAGVEQTCTVPQATPHASDFASSGNSAIACPGIASIPTGIADFLGPVNFFSLIVPKASSQLSISAEAAYFVWGFGQQGQAAPWVDESQLFRRDENSAAQLFISLNTGVPATKFKGIDTKTNQGTITAVAGASKPEAALGLVSGELADANRSTVRALAFQAKGQSCGYFADSTETAFDKKYVRDGHYAIWSPLHFFTHVGGDGKPSNANVARFFNLFTAATPDPEGIDILAAEIKSGTIPKCAMNVWRETDTGPISKLVPDAPCGCFFDKTATGTTTCAACTDSSTCSSASPVCRHGFCEAR